MKLKCLHCDKRIVEFPKQHCDKCEKKMKEESFFGVTIIGNPTGTTPLNIDLINTPPHYTKGGIEPIDYTISNSLNFCEGNIIKYVTRYKYKNGLEDLKKAEFYLCKLIEQQGKSID